MSASRLCFVTALLLLAGAHAYAAATPPVADTPTDWTSPLFPDEIFSASDADKAAMDIDPARYADFWKDWHFVTVRWRQDTHEFRFAYANDLAWKTLSEHRTDYPVGAMFGKLIYPSEEDLALPSSVLPSNLLNRLEIMLWDPANKHAAANGWVYLRIINKGPRTPQEKDSTGIMGVMSQKETKSCMECHARVTDRGGVFSQPLFLFRDPRHENDPDTPVLANRFGSSMRALKPDAVPRIAADVIRSLPDWNGRTVKAYEGDFFYGAFGEIQPVMTKLADSDAKSIFMIYDRDDPNSIELASRITHQGNDHCVGLVELSGYNEPPLQQKRAAQGVVVRDLSLQFKPSAHLLTVCDGEETSSQYLPLLYKAVDQDGLPNYYFAPAAAE